MRGLLLLALIVSLCVALSFKSVRANGWLIFKGLALPFAIGLALTWLLLTLSPHLNVRIF